MTTDRVMVLVLGVLVAAISGCGRSPAARFYLLSSTAPAGTVPAVHDAVVVGPVSVPGAVDRPQLVVHAGPNRVTLDEFNRWASPLADEIARTVAANLVALLGMPRVTSTPLPNFDAAYRVAIDVQRFESVPGEGVTVEAVWTVRPTAGGPARSGRTATDEPVTDATVEALVAAHSRALATVSADVAAAIRAAAAGAR